MTSCSFGSQPSQMLAQPHTPLILSHSLLAHSAWSSLVTLQLLAHLHSLQLTPQTHKHMWSWSGEPLPRKQLKEFNRDMAESSDQDQGMTRKCTDQLLLTCKCTLLFPYILYFPYLFLLKSHKYFSFPHLCFLLETHLNKFCVIPICSLYTLSHTTQQEVPLV